jgi:hypothetical protein
MGSKQELGRFGQWNWGFEQNEEDLNCSLVALVRNELDHFGDDEEEVLLDFFERRREDL